MNVSTCTQGWFVVLLRRSHGAATIPTPQSPRLCLPCYRAPWVITSLEGSLSFGELWILSLSSMGFFLCCCDSRQHLFASTNCRISKKTSQILPHRRQTRPPHRGIWTSLKNTHPVWAPAAIWTSSCPTSPRAAGCPPQGCLCNDFLATRHHRRTLPTPCFHVWKKVEAGLHHQ